MLQTKVKLEPISHKYYDDKGLEYLSVSAVLKLIQQVFKREERSLQSAAKRGISQQEILAEWDKTRDDSTDHGTYIHNALESFQNTAVIQPEWLRYIDPAGKENNLEPVIRGICGSYNDYARVFSEECLFDEEYRIAGTADKVLMVTSHKASKFDLEDYKTNFSKGIYTFNKYGNSLLHPLEHMEDCNFNTYALQLSFYAFMLERMTGRRCRQLHITFIPGSNLNEWRKIPVPYLKSDVINILNFYKKSILEKANKSTVVEQYEEPNF